MPNGRELLLLFTIFACTNLISKQLTRFEHNPKDDKKLTALISELNTDNCLHKKCEPQYVMMMQKTVANFVKMIKSSYFGLDRNLVRIEGPRVMLDYLDVIKNIEIHTSKGTTICVLQKMMTMDIYLDCKLMDTLIKPTINDENSQLYVVSTDNVKIALPVKLKIVHILPGDENKSLVVIVALAIGLIVITVSSILVMNKLRLNEVKAMG